jgi:hypothetical protein
MLRDGGNQTIRVKVHMQRLHAEGAPASEQPTIEKVILDASIVRTFDLTETPPDAEVDATAAMDQLDAMDDDMLAILESQQREDELGPESEAGLAECDAEPDEDDAESDENEP